MDRMSRCVPLLLTSCLCLTVIGFYGFLWYDVARTITTGSSQTMVRNHHHHHQGDTNSSNSSSMDRNANALITQRTVAGNRNTTKRRRPPRRGNSSSLLLQYSFSNAEWEPPNIIYPCLNPNVSFNSQVCNESSQFQQYGCLRHDPINITVISGGAGVNETDVTLEMKLRQGCGPLRRDWRDQPPLSHYAQLILQHQSNCSFPVVQWDLQLFVGIGSNLVHWSRAMCFAMEHNVRLQSVNPQWIWMDQTYCNEKMARQSPFFCYFPNMECLCHDTPEERQPAMILRKRKPCQKRNVTGFLPTFQAATIEYIFRSVSPLVIQEAQRQVGIVFGPKGAPDDMITVHVRWGDKEYETELAAIDEYIKGVWKVLALRGNINNSTSRANNTRATIYLATEDPQAATAFVQAAPPHWNVYMDVAIQELTPFRSPSSRWHGAAWMAKSTLGRAGLVHMASLLVSMETNDFVLSTTSSFGRIMNSLRTNVLDPRCGGCTSLVDVRPGGET